MNKFLFGIATILAGTTFADVDSSEVDSSIEEEERKPLPSIERVILEAECVRGIRGIFPQDASALALTLTLPQTHQRYANCSSWLEYDHDKNEIIVEDNNSNAVVVCTKDSDASLDVLIFGTGTRVIVGYHGDGELCPPRNDESGGLFLFAHDDGTTELE